MARPDILFARFVTLAVTAVIGCAALTASAPAFSSAASGSGAAGVRLEAARQEGARPAADAIARQVQTRYQTIQDFTADFTHTYEGGVLRRKSTERGNVLIKKPGKMRWTYTVPEEKIFVSDGIKIYMYVPADRQVTVSSMPADDCASTPILFLVGKGDLLRDFVVSDAEPNKDGVGALAADTYAIKLVPRTKVPEYEWLVLAVEKSSMKLRLLVTRDAQGGTSTFTFANLKENVKIPDARFTFTIPRGADVITQSP